MMLSFVNSIAKCNSHDCDMNFLDHSQKIPVYRKYNSDLLIEEQND
jgi:hypothetical protein